MSSTELDREPVRQLVSDTILSPDFRRATFGGAVRGDLGLSYRTQQEVLPTIWARFPYTAIICAGGLIVELVVGVSLGIVASVRKGGVADGVATTTASTSGSSQMRFPSSSVSVLGKLADTYFLRSGLPSTTYLTRHPDRAEKFRKRLGPQ